MQHELIKIKYQLKPFFHYFQKQHLINRPDSLIPQWSRQAVITVSRSTWNDKKRSNGVATNLFCIGVIGHRKCSSFYKN